MRRRGYCAGQYTQCQTQSKQGQFTLIRTDVQWLLAYTVRSAHTNSPLVLVSVLIGCSG
jgi:hypothetical protein